MMFGPTSRDRAPKQAVAPEKPSLVLRRDSDAPLEWRQPRWDKELYRLESPRGVLAVMQTVGFLNPATTVHTAAGVYRLLVRWNGGFKLFLGAEPEPRIDYLPGWWSDGRLERRGGEVLSWKMEGFSRHHVQTKDGFPLATFGNGKEWYKSGSVVTTHDALWRRADALELIIMGFAILVINKRHSSE